MVLSSHAGHVSRFVGQAFLHFFLFFLHFLPLSDLHWVNAVLHWVSQSAKETHGGGEAAGGDATATGGGGDATATGGGGDAAAAGGPRRGSRATTRAAAARAAAASVRAAAARA